MSEIVRGKFVVIEGIGGCGKDTQVIDLGTYLRNNRMDLFITREHDRNAPTGELIEEIIKRNKPEIDGMALQMLFIADRRNHYERMIKPQLEAGKMVLCNRYYPSTVAYSRPEWRQFMLDTNLSLVIRPDLVMIIDTDPVISANRVSKRGDPDIFDNSDTLSRCRQGYQWYAENSGDVVTWIDGNGTIEEVRKRIITEIKRRGII